MTWSWEEFSAQLGRALDDEDGASPAVGDPLRLDGLDAALRAMLAHHPRQATSQHTGVDQIPWPADGYRIAALIAADGDGYGAALTPATVGGPGETLGDPGSYWVWNGVIYLGAAYDALTLYYHASYPPMAVGVADIPVPAWAREAVVYRAAAHCLVPGLVGRARLGAYHDRADAPPLQNSLIQAADWFIAQFERVMAEHRGAG